MIEKVIAASLHNRFLMVVGTILLVAIGIWAVRNTPLDAIPDLSDVQVIVFTEFPGQAPQVVEDQVTYPLTTAMLAVPYANVVRGYSFFGLSFVYIIFEDGTDLYWARSRVLEYLNYVSGRLPDGVTPTLGPDATGGRGGFGGRLCEAVPGTGRSKRAGRLQDSPVKSPVGHYAFQSGCRWSPRRDIRN
jgi:Cu(I)/Ag(I) efflux system membrane protein CusA/SilA